MYLNKNFDIIIFGFGLVSKLLLNSLSKLNLRICIINRKAPNFFKSDIKRGIALNHSSCSFLKSENILEKIKLYGNKINKINILEKNYTSKIQLSSSDINNNFLSYVIEESYLETLITERINYEKITFFNNYALYKMKKNSQGWNIVIKNKKKIIYLNSKNLIAIDGSNSFMRNFFNIKKNILNYKSTAFVLNLYVNKINNNTAIQKIFNNGIIAVLPLKKNIMKAVITVNNKEKNYIDSLNLNELKLYIKTLLDKNIEEIKSITMPISYPLIGIKSVEIIKKNFLLMGNAAITLNPITAQGFNLAIKDIRCIINIIKNNIYEKKLILSYKNLLLYQIKRNYEHNLIFKNINIIFYFFKFDYILPKYLRQIFFKIFNNSLYLKKRFIFYKQGVSIE